MARIIQYLEQDARVALAAQREALGQIKSMNAQAEVEAQLSPQPVRQVVDQSAVALRELSAMVPTGADQAVVAHAARKLGNALAAQVARDILTANMMSPPPSGTLTDCAPDTKKALLALALKQYTGVADGWDLLAYDQQSSLRAMPLFVGLCPQPVAATASAVADDLGFSNWKQ
jgi:hypothetical protein